MIPVACARPSINIPKQRILPSCHSSDFISLPDALTHVTSFTPSVSFHFPVKKRPRRSTGNVSRSTMSLRAIFISSPPSSLTPSQSSQLVSLSWQYALLLPLCVRPNSSPARIIGVPCESSSVASMLRFCRSRNCFTALSSAGPSTPQFHELLFEVPSWLFSWLASLCLSLYETRSLSVKPSCAVMKLMLAQGLRPRTLKKSTEAASRVATWEACSASPFQ